ncbi:MAG: ABC transporter related protein [Clostridia bacterium 62_21]|nr:MAG: ABC transporter related protein [Clostridia bacterium 62_21]HAG07123.1 hypothetical protein [Peptococcaceae bacterium]
MPDVPDVYYNLRVSEFFALGKRFYPGWDEEAAARLLSLLSLPRERRLKDLSRGQRTQVALVFALSHHPRYLFLDEPTAGLDPLVRREVLRLVLEEAADRGTTVIYSTHNLADLERACDRIGLLRGGTIATEKAVFERNGDFFALGNSYLLLGAALGAVAAVVANWGVYMAVLGQRPNPLLSLFVLAGVFAAVLQGARLLERKAEGNPSGSRLPRLLEF